MGLDTVEIIMRIEGEFALSVSNSAAAKMASVGDLYSFVIQTLQERGDAVDEADIWSRLSGIIVDQLGVQPDEVTPSAHLVRDLKAD